MSNEPFNSIKRGLGEAIDHARSVNHKVAIQEVTPIDVKAVRAKVDMSQRVFAESFGISLGTLRHWERGDRQPRGPARVLLKVVTNEPDIVLKVLAKNKSL